jgi:hypothetical protein
MYRSASDLWQRCHGLRSGLIRRIERYAALTIPKVCYPDGYNSDSTDESHDYQSLGAQATNHLSNKLMMAMFAPSRPFAKLRAGKKAQAQAAQMKLTPVQLDSILAKGERDAVAALDNKGQRPKLFQVCRHLVVAGNCLLITEKDHLRVLGIKKYVVKRNVKGEVLHVCIREKVRFDELEPKIIEAYRKWYQDDHECEFYKWVKKEPNGSWTMTQWLDEKRLPKEYDGRWPADSCPYIPLTWDLADESDYGTGLVEEYIGDLEACSTLSESTVDGAVLGTEFRMMVNPAGVTTVDDLKNSVNGDYVPGMPQDVAPTVGGNPNSITVAETVNDKYEKRIARGFLMGSAVIRDAERVTTEEVRLTANELETAYGSVYSSLANQLQRPVAAWLFKTIELDLKGADLDITIVTGLDALSRSGDLDNFRLAMGDLATATAVPPELAARLKWEEIAAFIGQGRGVELSKFVMTDAQYAEKVQQQQAQQAEQQVATTAGEAAVTQGQ